MSRTERVLTFLVVNVGVRAYFFARFRHARKAAR